MRKSIQREQRVARQLETRAISHTRFMRHPAFRRGLLSIGLAYRRTSTRSAKRSFNMRSADNFPLSVLATFRCCSPTESLTPQPANYSSRFQGACHGEQDNASRLAQRAHNIRTIERGTLASVVDIGLELIAAEAECGHGQWANWLKTNFSWSMRTALRYRKVAEFCSSCDDGAYGPDVTSVTWICLLARYTSWPQ